MTQLKNKWLYLAFGAGLLLAFFLTPSKEVIKKEIEYKDKIVNYEVVKWKTKVVTKEVEKQIKVKSSKTKVTYPDGKIVETEIYESETEQVNRMRQLEEDKFKELLAQKESEYKETYSKTTTNPKKLVVYGLATTYRNKLDFNYGGGIMYTVGNILNVPVSAGVQITNDVKIGATVGLTF